MLDLEIHAEDQYAVVPADVTLAALQSALPANLYFRAPGLGITVGDWARAGGIGALAAPPARGEVLGLSYRSSNAEADPVEAGGRVVKNVSGYDLVRLVVGSDPSLDRSLDLETLTLRLRPRPAIAEREAARPEARLELSFAELHDQGAAFGLAYRTPEDDLWRVRGVWWGAAHTPPAPRWGDPVAHPVPFGALLRDDRGAFPRAKPERSELEKRVLGAL